MKQKPIVIAYSFARTMLGIIVRPYETYRKIIQSGLIYELVPLGGLLSLYFAVNALVKTAAFRPFTLTRHFAKTSGAALVSAILLSFLLWKLGSLMGGKGRYKNFALAWGYTLVPTVCWFLFTSMLYVLLPPPRTTNPTGIAFSFVFLTISTVLLFWKIILSYLALRFGLKLDLIRIFGVIALAAPFVVIYSIGMYRLGIFRIPFI